MRTLIWGASFRRAFKRRTRKNPHLREHILTVLRLLSTDPFAPSLKTHKLRGELDGLWACWVEYDCRIVFTFEPTPNTSEEVIVLIDVGTHDEVY